jgi:uncharacterized protein YlxW (UPF0749 family)
VILVGKARIDRNGLTREQRLLKENKELRRECQRLRKALSRLENFDHVKDVLEEDQQERLKETQMVLEDLKKAWACHNCDGGVLEITLYQKLTNTWYYRSCNGCGHRTPGKPYTKEVKGILKENKS